MVDLTQVVEAVVALFFACVTVLVVVEIVPRAKKAWDVFKRDHVTEAAFLESQAGLAVDAAEQVFSHGDNSNKLRYAIEYMDQVLERSGYKFNKFDVQTMVEANVKRLKDRTLAALKQ